MISLLTVCVGVFSTLSLAAAIHTPEQIPEAHKEEILFVHYAWTLLRICGCFVGLQGLVGLHTADASRIRGLCFFYMLNLCLDVPTFVIYESVDCEVLAAMKISHNSTQDGERLPTCDVERRRFLVHSVTLCVVHACFARAAWSLASLLSRAAAEGGPLPFAITEDPALGALRAPLMDTALAAGTMPPHRRSLAAAPGQPPAQPCGFRPFSGRPHRLD